MEELTGCQRMSLEGIVRDLHRRYGGAFSREMIEALVVETFRQRAATATVKTWLVLGTERACTERLDGLFRAAQQAPLVPVERAPLVPVTP